MAKSKSKKPAKPEQNILENGFLRVYSYNPATGEYAGEDEAQPSPLQPGVFLIPAHATEATPPERKEGHFRKFNGKEWSHEPIPGPLVVPKSTEALAANVRHERNVLLLSCDWRMLPDVPEKHKAAAWAEYRQALRDVPQQKGFPENINWPTEP
jgi:hypothetical protein